MKFLNIFHNETLTVLSKNVIENISYTNAFRNFEGCTFVQYFVRPHDTYSKLYLSCFIVYIIAPCSLLGTLLLISNNKGHTNLKAKV